MLDRGIQAPFPVLPPHDSIVNTVPLLRLWILPSFLVNVLLLEPSVKYDEFIPCQKGKKFLA